MGGSQRLAAGGGGAARTACARVLVRGGIDEKTGEALSAMAVAERHSARASTCTRTPPRPNGNQPPARSREHGITEDH